MKLTLKKIDKLLDKVLKYCAIVLGSIIGLSVLGFIIYSAVCNASETVKVIGGLVIVIIISCIIGALCEKFIVVWIIFKSILISFCIAIILQIVYALSVSALT